VHNDVRPPAIMIASDNPTIPKADVIPRVIFPSLVVDRNWRLSY
jgi:hypothetical protein